MDSLVSILLDIALISIDKQYTNSDLSLFLKRSIIVY
jgi:hypothetical protein